MPIQPALQPTQWYSDRDLFLAMDIPRQTQAKARAAGRLRYVQTGNTFQYKGQWVLDWLEEGAPTEPKAPERSRTTTQPAGPGRLPGPARVSTEPATASQARGAIQFRASRRETMSHPNSYQGGAIGEFERRVARKVAEGMTRPDAVRAVVREDPDLHQQYLVEQNLRAGRRRAAENLCRRR